MRVAFVVVGDNRGTIAALYDVREMPSSCLIDCKSVADLLAEQP